MSLKSLIQIIIIFIVIIILSGVYYNYFANNKKISLEKDNQTNIESGKIVKTENLTYETIEKKKINNVEEIKNKDGRNIKIEETKIVKNKITKGILTDGDLKRLSRKFEDFQKLEIKKVMKKNPISIDKDTLAAQALSIMNEKKITSLCIHHGKQKNKTIGIIHIHNILGANIS